MKMASSVLARCAIDTMIYPNGFDAVNGVLGCINLRDERGLTRRSNSGDGQRVFFGLLAAGFP